MLTYTPTTTLPDCEPASWHDWIDAAPVGGDKRTDECSICRTIRHVPHRGSVWYEVPNA